MLAYIAIQTHVCMFVAYVYVHLHRWDLIAFIMPVRRRELAEGVMVSFAIRNLLLWLTDSYVKKSQRILRLFSKSVC